MLAFRWLKFSFSICPNMEEDGTMRQKMCSIWPHEIYAWAILRGIAFSECSWVVPITVNKR